MNKVYLKQILQINPFKWILHLNGSQSENLFSLYASEKCRILSYLVC